jgi:hypothetical protein
MAPVVRLRTRKMLVWSEAWNAEGEKAGKDCSLKHTPACVRVPPFLLYLAQRFTGVVDQVRWRCMSRAALVASDVIRFAHTDSSGPARCPFAPSQRNRTAASAICPQAP